MRYNTNRTDDIRSVFLFRSDINSSVPSTVIAEYFHPKCRFHPALEQSHALAKEDTQQLVQEPELNKSRTRCSFSSGRPCLPSSTRQPRRSIPAGIEFKSYVLFWRTVSVEIPGSTIGGHGVFSREQRAGSRRGCIYPSSDTKGEGFWRVYRGSVLSCLLCRDLLRHDLPLNKGHPGLVLGGVE
jgi:hypothetical protein